MEQIIHYCWFGGKPKNKLIKRCILSWHKYFPNWTIIEWNENNFDVNKVKYTKDAYSYKNYAFVSDYVRTWALYTFGGLYFDVDVEIIKKFDSSITFPLLAFEEGSRLTVSPGLIMAFDKGNPLCKKILDSYDSSSFDTTFTICDRFTKLLVNKGLLLNNEFQVVDGINIYPTEYFCPINNYTKKKNITENTYCIHHYLSSWLTKKQRLSYFLSYILRKIKIKKE